jgi:hypothetical protein
MVPDLNYEYHTITIDSNGQAAANSFVSFLENPLKNVVEARLLASHIHTKTSEHHIFISIKELDSNFNDRATPVLNGAGTIGNIKGVFASIASTVTAAHGSSDYINNFVSHYDVSTQYINPIRKLDRFTVNMYNQNGDLLAPHSTGDPNYLIIKFTCMKHNL